MSNHLEDAWWIYRDRAPDSLSGAVQEIEPDMVGRILTLSGIGIPADAVVFAYQYPLDRRTGMDHIGELEEKAAWILRETSGHNADERYFTHDHEGNEVLAYTSQTSPGLYDVSLRFRDNMVIKMVDQDQGSLSSYMAEAALLPSGFRSGGGNDDMQLVVRVNTRRSLDRKTPAFIREIRGLKLLKSHNGVGNLLYHPLGNAAVEMVLGNIIPEYHVPQVGILRTMRTGTMNAQADMPMVQ